MLLIAYLFNRFECFVAADSGKHGEIQTLVARSKFRKIECLYTDIIVRLIEDDT